MDHHQDNVRDRLVQLLHGLGLGARALQRLQLSDVVRDVHADFLESRPDLVLQGRKRRLSVDPTVRECIENYVNAAHHAGSLGGKRQGPPWPRGRPFLDYRPDIGQHLFPSPRTGDGLSRRSLWRTRPDPTVEEEQ